MLRERTRSCVSHEIMRTHKGLFENALVNLLERERERERDVYTVDYCSKDMGWIFIYLNSYLG